MASLTMFGNTSKNNDGGVVHGTAVVGGSVLESKQQEVKCRDPLFAILFYVNIGIIAGLVAVFGKTPFQTTTTDSVEGSVDNDENTDSIDYTPFIHTSLVSCGIGMVLAVASLFVLMAIPGFLIKVALLFNVVLTGVMAAAMFLRGEVIIGIIMVVCFALFVCYACAVWSRIPFATANLVTATQAVKANCGVTILSYGMVIVAVGWSILWATAVVGAYDKTSTCTTDNNNVQTCGKPNYLVSFFLFLSYFFTHQVLQNTIHVTVAGVIGTWWFAPNEGKGCCNTSILGSFIRATTTSFGSICFGSLLVAIIQALRAIADQARQNDDVGQFLACCIDCLLSCIQGIIEYFNKWAFIYVGLYGYGYCEAGKSVMGLFRDRGWDAIIADDLVGMVLGMLSLVGGLITGGLAILIANQQDWFDDYEADGGINPDIFVFLIGLVIGLVLVSIFMSTIGSAVNTVIVLFADAPAEFQENYPELSRTMRETYNDAYPDVDLNRT